jgi:sec-independent protein translocase protein TatC
VIGYNHRKVEVRPIFQNMADDSQTSDSPENPEKNDSGQEPVRPEKPTGSEPTGPELNFSSSGRTRDQANLPRKSVDKEESGEKVKPSGTGSESNNDNGEESHDHDPHHDDHHHDDYHDPAHYEDDYHQDHPEDGSDDWWEEDEKDEVDQLSPAGEMSFLDHLEDLRSTLFKSIGALIFGCLVVGINLKLFADWLQFPIDFAGLDIDLRTRQPLGVLMVMMQVVFFGGLAVSLPFIIMFVSGFVAPGLTKREKRMLLPGSIAAVILFLAGAALAFFFIIPVSLKFSAVLNEWMNIELLWDVNDYYSLVVMVTLAIGALFQFPLLLVITGYLGILPASKLRKGRKLVFVIIIIVAALLTPGDVIVALVLLTIPLYGLFEGSIIMVAYVERGKAHRQARVEERRKKREIDRDTAKQKATSALVKDKPEDNPAPEKDREGE